MRNDESYESHRSAMALFLKFLAVLLPITICYVIGIIFFRSSGSIAPQVLSQLTLLYRVTVSVLILEMVRRYYNDLYVFGHNRVIRFRGRLSLRYGRVAIAFKDIRDVGIKQSLVGRIFNYGTVTFGTASKDGFEVTMIDLPHPHRFASMVQDHIHTMRKQKALFEAAAALDASLAAEQKDSERRKVAVEAPPS